MHLYLPYSISIIPTKIIHVVAKDRISFFFVDEQYFIVILILDLSLSKRPKNVPPEKVMLIEALKFLILALFN